MFKKLSTAGLISGYRDQVLGHIISPCRRDYAGVGNIGDGVIGQSPAAAAGRRFGYGIADDIFILVGRAVTGSGYAGSESGVGLGRGVAAKIYG
jgi:hypothetical protein